MTNKLFSFIVLVLFALTGCQIKQSQQKTFEYAIPVITGSVIKTLIANEISLIGNIEGSRTVRLCFKVAGKVVEFRLEDLKIRSNRRDAGLNLESDLLSAKAAMAKAESDYLAARLIYRIALSELKILTGTY
jgi:hypothetical protein